MCVSAVISAGASLIGGAMASKGAKKQAKATTDAARQQHQAQLAAANEYKRSSAIAQMGMAGGQAATTYQDLMFGGDPTERLMSRPGVAAALKAGRDAIGQSAVFSGTSISGKTMKDLADYQSQALYGMYNTELDRLGGLLGAADDASARMANIKIGAAGDLAQGMTSAAQMRSGATQARLDALSSAAQPLGQIGQNLFSRFGKSAMKG